MPQRAEFYICMNRFRWNDLLYMVTVLNILNTGFDYFQIKILSCFHTTHEVSSRRVIVCIPVSPVALCPVALHIYTGLGHRQISSLWFVYRFRQLPYVRWPKIFILAWAISRCLCPFSFFFSLNWNKVRMK